MKIRRAALADAERIGVAHAQVWRETYRGILSDEWIAGVSSEERIARWKVILGEATLPQACGSSVAT